MGEASKKFIFFMLADDDKTVIHRGFHSLVKSKIQGIGKITFLLPSELVRSYVNMKNRHFISPRFIHSWHFSPSPDSR